MGGIPGAALATSPAPPPPPLAPGAPGAAPAALVGTLFACCPPALGGAPAPISGALGVVVFGRFAPEPGMPGLAPLVPGPLGLRFGSLGLDELGGVARDIIASQSSMAR